VNTGVSTGVSANVAHAAKPAGGSFAERGEAWLLRLFARPRLSLLLAGVAVALSSPCLLLGFYIDDWVGRYIYSDLPGAHRLLELWKGGYGLANGVPATNLWQIEQGWAPWWTYERLSIALLRPLGMLTHMLDARLWPDTALLHHAHSLVWLALLVLAATRMYRGALGPVVGGCAALLFALDHTRGFAVGYAPNRYALLAVTFGALCLDQHMRARLHGDARGRWLAPLCLALALMSGELAVAVLGYLFAFALFADRGGLRQRVLSLLPYVVIAVIWAAVYSRGGYGAKGSGLYIDPGREPLTYLQAFLERAPVLVLGLFVGLPAELRMVVAPWLGMTIQVAALLWTLAMGAALIPLLRRDRMARFWAAGLLCALVPACSAFPHNRQLIFASLGGMALIAQSWQLFAFELRDAALGTRMMAARFVVAVPFGTHLLLSPLLAPLMVCSSALMAPLQRPLPGNGDDMAGRDVVFMTAPDYLAVRHVQLQRRVEHRPLPRRLRALSFHDQPVTVRRTDARTLELEYAGGILDTPFLELYRERRLKMAVGEHVALKGLLIEVLAVTADGRVLRARFSFDTDLDAASFVYYAWIDGRFERYRPPRVGQTQVLPPARLEWGLK
jgi:hypothetical protein